MPNGRKRLFEELEEVVQSSGQELSPLGKKNKIKLELNGQLETGVSPKRCQLCGAMMDWRINGAIQRVGKKYYYQGYCNGDCKKRGVNYDAQAHERWTKEEIERVEERISALKELGDLEDEVAQEESYRESLIENCPNLKAIFAAETTKNGFVEYIARCHSSGYDEDKYPALKVAYGRLLDGFDYLGPNDELSGLPMILRKSPSFDSEEAGFVWVAQRWNNDLGHLHKEQELAHFSKFSNRFCNDASKDTIHQTLRNIITSFLRQRLILI